ncbi:MAG: DUF4097 family beta strand repeat protein [Lachnospiraceae bacterium]|nr:DUF4097 family beta strand repeat protein [Lachnospiraceae bacterium]
METIRDYLNNMFSKYPSTPEILRAKAELGQMMEDKFNELIAEGKNQNEAIGTVISEFGDVDELIADLGGASGAGTADAPPASTVEGKPLAVTGQMQYAQPQYADPQQAQYSQPQYADPQQAQYAQYVQPQYADSQQAQYSQPQYADPQQAQYAQYAQPQYGQPYSQPQYAQQQYAQPQYQEPAYGDDMFEDEYSYGAFGQYGMGYDGGYQAPVQYAPSLTYEEAATIAKLGKRRGLLKAIGLFLCITCVVWPVLGDSIPWFLGGPLFEALSVLGMFASIAIGVLSFISAGNKTKQIEAIRRGKHTPDPQTQSMIQSDWQRISTAVSSQKAVGILACSTCIFPTILTSRFSSEFMGNLGAALMFGMVGLGVGLIVHSNSQKSTYRSLMLPMERGAYYTPDMKSKDGFINSATSGLAAGASVMASAAGDIIRTAKAKSGKNTFLTEPFSQIDIKLSRGNVDIKTGDTFRLDLSGPVDAPPVWGIENGRLTITNPQNVGFIKHKKVDVTITVPAGVTLTNVDTHLSLGNIYLKDAVIEQTKATSDMGNVTAEGVSAGILRANSSMGNVVIKRTGATQGYLSSSMGNVKFDGVFQHLEANTSMGNIDVSTQTELSGLVPENEAILATSMGVVTFNGKKCGKGLHLPE